MSARTGWGFPARSKVGAHPVRRWARTTWTRAPRGEKRPPMSTDRSAPATSAANAPELRRRFESAAGGRPAHAGLR
eukprot:274813-Lingulodinium_polyedra.AAC.1